MERLKRELARAVRPTSPAPTDISEHVYRDNGLNGSYNGGRNDSMGRSAGNRLSLASAFSGEDKENGYGHERGSRMSPTLREGTESGRASAAGNRADSIESWKRAAEVTSQLKLRIEVFELPRIYTLSTFFLYLFFIYLLTNDAANESKARTGKKSALVVF